MKRLAVLLAGTAFLVSGLIALLDGRTVGATHEPADKVAVAASTVTVVGPIQVAPGSTSAPETLLSASLKTSKPTDLIHQVTLECTLQTDVKTVGDADSTAFAQLKVWVEVDGIPVAVAGTDTLANAEVIFCDREFRLKTSDFQPIVTPTIEAFLKTRSAHGFNWIDLNLGSGTHTIDVKAVLTALVAGNGKAQALVGKRTLVVEPTKLANDVTIGP